jgi:tetraacyldisaccharide 4'-kinase
VSGIGEPTPFEQQLTAAGARVTGFRFADHHAYTAEDVRDLLVRVPADALVVCTLKDAVKLGLLWPVPAPPLWYLSQRITVERGGAAIDAALAALPQRFLARARVTVDLPPTNR